MSRTWPCDSVSILHMLEQWWRRPPLNPKHLKAFLVWMRMLGQISLTRHWRRGPCDRPGRSYESRNIEKAHLTAWCNDIFMYDDAADNGDPGDIASLPTLYIHSKGGPARAEVGRIPHPQWHQPLDSGPHAAQRPWNLGAQRPWVQPGQVFQWHLGCLQVSTHVHSLRHGGSQMSGPELGNCRVEGGFISHIVQVLFLPLSKLLPLSCIQNGYWTWIWVESPHEKGVARKISYPNKW